MKYFVTGVCGQLGFDVLRRLGERGLPAAGSDLPERYTGPALPDMEYVSADITDRESVAEAVLAARPDCVIHCAAWTRVDAAEDSPGACRLVNAEGTRNVAEACRRVGASMIYISTDYVFNGRGEEPWEPDSKSIDPLNVYGQTKREGELAAAALVSRLFVVRTSWVFGLNGQNFVRAMLRLGREKSLVRVVSDQIGTPCYTYDLAGLLVSMSLTEKYGFYHASNEGGYISWYDFACEIFRQAGLDTRAGPVTTEEYGLSKAPRPHNSRLNKDKLERCGFGRLPHWRDALARYLQELKEHSGE